MTILHDIGTRFSVVDNGNGIQVYDHLNGRLAFGKAVFSDLETAKAFVSQFKTTKKKYHHYGALKDEPE